KSPAIQMSDSIGDGGLTSTAAIFGRNREHRPGPAPAAPRRRDEKRFDQVAVDFRRRIESRHQLREMVSLAGFRDSGGVIVALYRRLVGKSLDCLICSGCAPEFFEEFAFRGAADLVVKFWRRPRYAGDVADKRRCLLDEADLSLLVDERHRPHAPRPV